jgi:NADH-quinone oxidoreductase subunit G
VILPIGALPEVDATLTNLDGVEQSALAGGKLPGQAREGWRVLRALGGELGLPGFEFTDLAGARALLEGGRKVTVKAGRAGDAGGNGLELALVPAIYRTDAVVRRAPALQAHPLNVEARIVLNPADAGTAGLADGTVAKIRGGSGTATLPVVVDDRVAAGAAWIEGGHGATAPLGAGRVEVVKA